MATATDRSESTIRIVACLRRYLSDWYHYITALLSPSTTVAPTKPDTITPDSLSRERAFRHLERPAFHPARMKPVFTWNSPGSRF